MAKLKVCQAWYNDLCEFVDREDIPLEPVLEGECVVQVILGDRNDSCSLQVLYAGGIIRCATARKMASRLQITLKQMGGLLDHLDAKVRECGLGCF